MVAANRDWITLLADPGTFLPVCDASGARPFAPEVRAGVVTVGGRPVAVYAHDPAVEQGYVSSAGAKKIRRLQDRALELGIPLVAFAASPGISIKEGLASGDEYTAVITGNLLLSGIVPQLTAVMSVVIGAPAYSAVLTDLTLFNQRRSYMMVSSPGIVKQSLGETTTFARLGGAQVHAQTTGLAHFVDATEAEQLARLKWLLAFLPANSQEDPTPVAPKPPRATIPELPQESFTAFDMRSMLSGLVDDSLWMEYAEGYGEAMITAFAYLGGMPIGILANQSLHNSGAIDADAAAKCARFTRLCDAYNIPLLSLIDVPGYLPGEREESRGILRHGAAMIKGLHTRTPKVSVIVRRCYGAAAFVMMQSVHAGGDVVLALAGARIAVMGYDAARSVVYPDAAPGLDLSADYYRDYEQPEIAQGLGLIDQIVKPEDLRDTLLQHLRLLRRRRDRQSINYRGISP